MRRPVAALLVVVALLGAACRRDTEAIAGNPAQIAQVPEHGQSPPRGISVSGEGEVMGTPDVLTVDLGVSVLRDQASQAIAEAAQLAEEVIAVLTAAGVARQDIQTRTYSIVPEYEYSQDTPRLVGYRVQNVLTAKLRELDRAGQTIDAAAAAAGEDVVVHGIRFDIEDNQALLEAARTAAWEDARAKAEQLAGLAGVDLG
ncbi:MAG: SIMPL domain-containing protein [Acidimicrobiia bacterium]